MKHVGTTICIALGVSLLLAQTVVPLFASRLALPKPSVKKTLVDKLTERYSRVLAWTLGHRKASVGIAFLILLSVAVPAQFVKNDMFEDSEDRRLRLRYHINDSYTVEKVEETVDKFEEFLFDHQDELGIESVYSYYQGNYAMSTILLREGDRNGKSVEDIKDEILEGLPKVAIANPSFSWRQNDRGESVRIRLVGKSTDELVKLSQEVAWSLAQIDGLTDVRSDAEVGEKEVQVVVDRVRARQHGLSAQEVANVVSAAMRGIRLRSFRDQDGEVDMRLEFQDSDRQTIEQLRNLPLYSGEGRPIKLASIADFHIKRGPHEIRREDRTTSLGVRANLDGITVGEAKERIGYVMKNFHFPPGYSWNYGRRFDYEAEARNQMLINLLLALALIYFVMASLFESLLFPAAIWTQIIFAVVGVYWFFLMTGTTMSIMAMIGILILIGVVVNNAIVLIDHINQLRASSVPRREAIIQAGRDRIRPILMTAATTVLSLVPLCVVRTQIGGEGGPPYAPMARAIVGGLTFCTIVTLLILPTIYTLLDDLRNWARGISRAAKNP
jgi:HAE1 family hydrophobic/amphiphilic exporter-1